MDPDSVGQRALCAGHTAKDGKSTARGGPTSHFLLVILLARLAPTSSTLAEKGRSGKENPRVWAGNLMPLFATSYEEHHMRLRGSGVREIYLLVAVMRKLSTAPRIVGLKGDDA